MENKGKVAIATLLLTVASEILEAHEESVKLATEEQITTVSKNNHNKKKNPHPLENDNTAIYEKNKSLYNISALPSSLLKKTDVQFSSFICYEI